MAATETLNAIFHSQFLKTSFCRFHTMGKCRNGTGCNFAHSLAELQEAPDLTKTSMCKAWQQGRCELSSKECQYAHGSHEVRVTPMFKGLRIVRGGPSKHQRVKRKGSRQSVDQIQQNLDLMPDIDDSVPIPSIPPSEGISNGVGQKITLELDQASTSPTSPSCYNTNYHMLAAVVPVTALPNATMQLMSSGALTPQEVQVYLTLNLPEVYED